MANSATDIAVNSSNYTGSAQLGGSGELAIQIDTRPIQQLAAYTLMYNKSQYDQRQKDADQKIKELGSLAPYDLVNGIEKDATELKSAQAKLTNFMAEYASEGTPKTSDEKIEKTLKFQSKISEQIKLINAANSRKIKLDTYTNATQANTKLSAQEKELRISQAKKLFNDTDINTLPDIPEYGLTMPVSTDPIMEKVNVIKTGLDGNAVIDEQITQFSIGNNWKTSYLDANNLMPPILPPNATEQQKNEYEQKKLAFSKSDIGVWQSAAQSYNAALIDPNYKKTITTTDINVIGAAPNTALTEEVDVERIKQANPIVGGIISLAERYNAYAAKRLEDIKNGYYIDTVTGEKVLLTGGDKVADVKFIDVNKPLKPEDLSFLDKFERAAPDQIDKKLMLTDNAIQGQQMATQIKLKQMDEAGANYRARLAASSKGDKDEKQPEVINKPAELFLQHVERLKEKFSKNGNKSITTGFPGIDEKTRIATGIKIDQSIIYNPDGSYEIQDDIGKSISKGLIENLAQGFIEAVKTSDIDRTKDKDGSMAEGFQRKSEERFKQVFGTTSGKAIWDGWNKSTTQSAPTTNDSETIPEGTILTGTDGKKIKTNRVITKKEAADAGYK